ncbi:hypothetical protein [Pseudodesulfovibrio karagichevae]|uniref:Uncharacterized protein n=1 Tax=Pseudodesulfovibrio karagichevae TaxID=3239305 RepID=A0ABV4K0L3_9BACT
MGMMDMLDRVDTYLTEPLEDGQPRSLIYSGLKGSVANLGEISRQFNYGNGYMVDGTVVPVDPQRISQAVMDWGAVASPVGGMMNPKGALGTFGGKTVGDVGFEVSERLAKTLGLKREKVWGDLGHLVKKHPEYFKDPREVSAIIEHVLEHPDLVTEATDPRFKLIMNELPWANSLVVDPRLKGGKHRIRSTHVSNRRQFERKNDGEK